MFTLAGGMRCKLVTSINTYILYIYTCVYVVPSMPHYFVTFSIITGVASKTQCIHQKGQVTCANNVSQQKRLMFSSIYAGRK